MMEVVETMPVRVQHYPALVPRNRLILDIPATAPVMGLALQITPARGRLVMGPTLVLRISVLRRDVRQKQLYTMIVPRASQPR